MTLVLKIKLRWAFFLFLILIVLQEAKGNTIQDLKAQLEEVTSETERIDLLIELSSKYYNQSDISQTYSYAQDALTRAEKIDYQKGIAYSLNKLALYNNVTGARLKAIDLNKKALVIARVINEEYLLSIISNNLGYAYYNLGLYDIALEYYFEAIPYAKKNENDHLNVIILENICNIFIALGDDEKGDLYCQKAGEIAQSSTDSLLHYIPDLNLAKEFNEEKNYLLAEKYYRSSLKKTYTLNHKSYVLRQFAFSYQKQKKYSIAEAKIKEAIDIYEQSKDIGGLITAKNELVQILNEMSRYEEALQIVSELLNKYKEENTQKDILLDMHAAAAYAHKQLGNHQNAAQNYQAVIALKDSIFDEQKIKIINGLDVKYNLKEQEQENYFLRSEQEKSEVISKQQKKIVIFTTLLFLLFLIISLLLYRANNQKKQFNSKLGEQVKIKTKELKKSNLQLKESNIELERFAYIASHDLKEPLRNITSFSQLLERKLKTPDSIDDLLEYASFIQRNAKQMNKLIEDILEFSSKDSQNLSVEKVNTKKILLEVEELLAYEIRKKNAHINVSPMTPDIYGLRTQILLVFKNLIMNGIKYNKSEKPQVDITYKEVNGFHQFCIQDNGIGIDQQYHKAVFEMFKRLHNRSEYEGSGLGLAMSRKAVNKMGGKIWLEPVDQGSCFCFTLPVVNIQVPNYSLN